MKVGDKVEIVAISKKDAFYSKRHQFIGATGTLEYYERESGPWVGANLTNLINKEGEPLPLTGTRIYYYAFLRVILRKI